MSIIHEIKTSNGKIIAVDICDDTGRCTTITDTSSIIDKIVHHLTSDHTHDWKPIANSTDVICTICGIKAMRLSAGNTHRCGDIHEP